MAQQTYSALSNLSLKEKLVLLAQKIDPIFKSDCIVSSEKRKAVSLIAKAIFPALQNPLSKYAVGAFIGYEFDGSSSFRSCEDWMYGNVPGDILNLLNSNNRQILLLEPVVNFLASASEQ